MLRNSLRLRLLVAGGITLAIALAVAGFGLEILFERHVQRRAVTELETDIRQLLAGLQVDPGGTITLNRTPADQRYDQPLSGLYWQIKSAGNIVRRSRSLWDDELALPPDDLPDGGHHVHLIPGLSNAILLAVERKLSVRRGDKTFILRLAAAKDRSEIVDAVKNFREDLVMALVLLGISLLIALWTAINLGLSPMRKLREALSRLRAGQSKRLTGSYPSEVAPLVVDLNDMLDQQDRSIEQARARAADLAHGLKTPLTALSMLAEEMQEQGARENGLELAQYSARMQRYVERELILARTSSSSHRKSDSTRLNDIVPQMVRTMRRLPRGNQIEWKIDLAKDDILRIDDTIVGEILGNLLDNARKWARSTVCVRSSAEAGRHVITIVDDGPGVAADKLNDIDERGGRLDSRRDSTGLGLSIVKDILDQLGGRLDVYSPPRGQDTGLEVVVQLQ